MPSSDAAPATLDTRPAAPAAGSRSAPEPAASAALQTIALITGVLFLCILPVPHTIAIRSALLLVLVACALLVWRKPPRPALPLRWPIALWICAAFLSLVAPLDFAYSLSEIKSEIGYGLAAYFAFFVLAARLPLFAAWRWAFLWSTAALGLMAVGWRVFAEPAAFAEGPYGGAGTLATWLVLAAAFCSALVVARRPSRLRLVVVFGLLAAYAAGAWASQNRMVWLLFAITAVTWAVVTMRRAGAHGPRITKGRVAAALAAVVLVAGSLYLFKAMLVARGGTQGAVAVRADMRPAVWRFSVARIAEAPVTGYGFGRGAIRKALFAEFHDRLLWHAHNLVLDYTLQMGWFGPVVLLVLFGGVAARHRVAARSGDPALQALGYAGLALVGLFLLRSMVDDFFYRHCSLLFWALNGAIFGECLRLQHPAVGSASGEARPRFLVIRRDNIGDLVLTTPLLAGLRARHPRAWIAVLANSYNAPVLAGNPDVDEVIAYRKAKHGETTRLAAALERLRLVMRLRTLDLDVVVLATPGWNARLQRLAESLGPRRVVGFVASRVEGAGMDAVGLAGLAPASEAELVWRLAERMDVTGPPPAARVVPAAAVVARARQAISGQGWRDTGPLLGVHISARKPSQRWPVARFAELMRVLHEREGARFMLFWAPGDAANPMHPGDDEKARELLRLASGLPVLPWPTHGLDELIGGMAACDRMVMSDGGAMHIAAALGKPILAFFGKSDPVRWRPWKTPYVLLQTDGKDVEQVTVTDALEGYDRLARSALA